MSAGTRVGAFMGAYFASIALTAFMPLFFSDRGLSAESIGHILGTATFLRILAGPGWGNVTDRFGRRRMVGRAIALLVICPAGSSASGPRRRTRIVIAAAECAAPH